MFQFVKKSFIYINNDFFFLKADLIEEEKKSEQNIDPMSPENLERSHYLDYRPSQEEYESFNKLLKKLSYLKDSKTNRILNIM